MFCVEEIAELLPKSIARTARIQLDGNICYLKNICHTKHPLYPELAVKQANENRKNFWSH